MKKNFKYPATLLIFLLTGLVDATRAQEPDLAPGWHDDQAISVNGTARYYRYYVPETLSSRPAAVLFLHGGNRSMRTSMPPASNGSAVWPAIADENGFVLIVPNGTDRQTGDALGDKQVWNDCRVSAPDVQIDDTGFLVELIDFAVTDLGVDSQRVYVTGSSNGGLMSFRMAIEAPDLVAAIAPFIANQPVGSECLMPNEPMPIMLTLGTSDPLMPFEGGEVASSGTFVRSADATLNLWLEQNGLAGIEPTTTTRPDLDPGDGSVVESRLWSAENSPSVRLDVMIGGGHAMPSPTRRLSAAVETVVGPQNHDVEGAREAWEFLEQFTLADTPGEATPAGALKPRTDTDAGRDATGTGQLFESIHVPVLTDYQQGTNGFAIADLDQDGWLDIVTVTTPPLKLGLNDTIVRDQLRILINKGGFEFESHPVELTGSAATPEDLGQDWRGSQIPALADFNDDGWLDLFISRQCPCQGGHVRPGFTPVGNSLFISQGDFFRFEDRSSELNVGNEMAYNRQPSIGDVNQDGFLDIAVGADNTTNAFEGLPDSTMLLFEPNDAQFDGGRFVDISNTELLPDFGGFTGDPEVDKAGPNLALRDMDNDGDLDLLQSTHVIFNGRFDAEALPLSPARYRQGVFTWRNQLSETGVFGFEKITGNGLAAEARLTFDAERGVYRSASRRGAPGLAYLMVADVNNNGLFDVIAVDASDPTFTPKTLDVGGRFWRNLGDFHFQNITSLGFRWAECPRCFIRANARRAGVSAVDGFNSLNATYEAWYDFFDNQVTPQLLTPILPINAMTAQPGLDSIRPLDLRPYHADVIFADFDNDTWLDFFVLDRREATLLETRAIFYHNQGNGDFEPLPTTLSGLDGTGIAGEAGDLNNDGLVDLIVAGDPDNSNENESLFASPDRYVDKVYMNTGALGGDNHWLRLRFSGISHGRLIGSRVEIFDTQTGQHLGTRGVYTHHSYKTGSPLQVHFGLGAHDRVDLRVSLPSGELIESGAIQANRFMDLDLGDATLTEVHI
ncbi:MAG: FG-GAP-like repeat-containing protein [Xanthomonadales bacterium]|nr:FG-GAP-like repeat-containing protein [Xanthomonadales bacterium]